MKDLSQSPSNSSLIEEYIEVGRDGLLQSSANAPFLSSHQQDIISYHPLVGSSHRSKDSQFDFYDGMSVGHDQPLPL